MNISLIPNIELVQDYKKLDTIEAEYFKLCKKYSPDDIFETDDAFRKITLELGGRAIEGTSVKTVNVSPNPLIQQEDVLWGNTLCPCCAVLLKTHNRRGLMHCLHYAVSKGVNLKENNTTADIVKRLADKITQYKPEPHECKDCCDCELTEQGKSELKLLESILYGENN
jgi:hypothetical protein